MNLLKTSILGVGILLGASAASANIDIIGPSAGTVVGNSVGIAGNCDVGYEVKIFVTDINGTMTPTVVLPCSANGWYTGNLDLSLMARGTLRVKTYQFINNVNIAASVDLNKQSGTAPTPPPATPPPVVVEKSGYVDIIGPEAGAIATKASLGIAGNCYAGVSVKVVVTDANNAATSAVNLACAANGWYTGSVDISGLAVGSLKLKATQLINGSTYASNVTITKQSSTTPPPVTPPPPPPEVEKSGYVDIIGPEAGAIATKAALGIAGNCAAGISVKVIVTDANNAATPAVNLACATNGWYSGSVDISSLAAGSLKIKATQLINGSTYASNVVITKQGGTTTPPPPVTPPPAGSGSYEFPASPVGTATASIRAVSTFNNISLYFKPSDGSVSREALVRYRAQGTSVYSQAQSLWFDKRLPAEMGGITERSQEYRGSIVGLKSGTTYEIEVFLTGVNLIARANVTTMNENFPIAKTVVVGSRSTTLMITEGGSASGYVLYVAASGGATIDVANQALFNVDVQAPYVIIRGFTLKGAQKHAIRLKPQLSDVVIEDNDISGWGRLSNDGFAVNGDAGVGSDDVDGIFIDIQRLIVQRNKFHHPRFDSNSWDKEPRPDYGGSTHPAGAQSIYIRRLTGQFIYRFNSVYSDADHYFNDCVGGESNFSWDSGFPGNDADIHDNTLSHCWDDGIESEGNNINVRVYNNYIEKAYIGNATSSTSIGPIYVFRNISGSLQYGPNRDPNSTGYGFKAQGVQAFGGRVYLYHNTMLFPQLAGVSDFNKSLQGMVTRNNIFRATSGGKTVVDKTNAPDTDVNYDLVDGAMDTLNTNHERNGIFAAPQFDMSLPANKRGLLPGSPGRDAGIRLPNFNDGYLGGAPDMGAVEK